MQIEDGFVCTKSYLENLYLREGREADLFSTGTIMLLDRSNMTRTHIDAWFAENDIEPKQVLETTTMDLLIEFSKIGLGIGCVIKDFVKKEPGRGKPYRDSPYSPHTQEDHRLCLQSVLRHKNHQPVLSGSVCLKKKTDSLLFSKNRGCAITLWGNDASSVS